MAALLSGPQSQAKVDRFGSIAPTEQSSMGCRCRSRKQFPCSSPLSRGSGAVGADETPAIASRDVLVQLRSDAVQRQLPVERIEHHGIRIERRSVARVSLVEPPEDVLLDLLVGPAMLPVSREDGRPVPHDSSFGMMVLVAQSQRMSEFV